MWSTTYIGSHVSNWPDENTKLYLVDKAYRILLPGTHPTYAQLFLLGEPPADLYSLLTIVVQDGLCVLGVTRVGQISA